MEYLSNTLTDNAFIFQNYVLDIHQQRIETLETVQNPCKAIAMDHADLMHAMIFTNGEYGLVHKIWISTSRQKSTYDLNQNSFQANCMLPMESLI